jgi:hypothetical protein
MSWIVPVTYSNSQLELQKFRKRHRERHALMTAHICDFSIPRDVNTAEQGSGTLLVIPARNVYFQTLRIIFHPYEKEYRTTF